MNASLQKKGKIYYVVIGEKTPEGKWKYQWISTKCKKKGDADKVFLDIISKKESETYIKPNNMLFSDFMIEWLENTIKNQVEVTTYDGYTTNIKTHIAPYFNEKGIKLKDLKAVHLQKYFDEKYKNGKVDGTGGLSASFLKKHYFNIKKALDYAVKMEVIPSNPIKNVSLPKVQKYHANYYTVEQLEILLKTVIGTSIESAVFLTAHYGFRRGEVLGLRWQDINFEEGTLTICNTRVRVLTNVEKKPKTESSLRVLPLIPIIADYLKKLKKEQLENKLMFGSKYISNDYVCKNRDGSAINIGTLDHAFKRTLTNNQLPPIRFHDLRHSTASYLLKNGLSLKEIQVWLGHANIAITADTYSHMDMEMKKNTADKINNIFSKASNF